MILQIGLKKNDPLNPYEIENSQQFDGTNVYFKRETPVWNSGFSEIDICHHLYNDILCCIGRQQPFIHKAVFKRQSCDMMWCIRLTSQTETYISITGPSRHLTCEWSTSSCRLWQNVCSTIYSSCNGVSVSTNLDCTSVWRYCIYSTIKITN